MRAEHYTLKASRYKDTFLLRQPWIHSHSVLALTEASVTRNDMPEYSLLNKSPKQYSPVNSSSLMLGNAAYSYN